MPQSQGTRFTADPLTFIVRHQLWDANVEDHSDQGISIEVAADVGGTATVLLRFNCFDIEKSYIYGPENPALTTDGRVGGGTGVHCEWTLSPMAIPSAGPSEPRGKNSPRCWTGRDTKKSLTQPISPWCSASCPTWSLAPD